MAQKEKKISNSLKRPVKMEESNQKITKFFLSAPEATQVCLAGDFNNWDIQSLPLERNQNSQWEITIQLSPGRYEYKYLVDGSWFDNIPGVEKVWNSYGTQNCVIYVR